MFKIIVFFLTVFTALPAAAEFKIGVVLPLTGGLGINGTAVKNGIELARLQHPSRFEKIAFFYEDDRGDVRTTLTAYHQLRTTRAADLFIVFSANARDAVASLVESHQTPLLPLTFTPNRGAGRSYMVRPFNPSREYIAVLVAELQKRGITSSPVICTEFSFLKDMVDELCAVHTCTEKIFVNPEETDFRSSITKLRAAKSSAVGLFMIPPQLTAFVRQQNDQGYRASLFGTDLFESAARIGGTSLSFEGALYPDNHPTQEFQDAYRKQYGNGDQLTFAAAGHDMAILLAKIVESDPKVSRATILAALRNVKGNRGALGTFDFVSAADGDQFFRYPVQVKEIRGDVGVPVGSKN